MTSQKFLSIDPNTVNARLGLCAVALVGTAAAIPAATATVIVNNTPIPIPQTVGGVYINFLTGGTGGSAGAVPGWDLNPYNSNGGSQLGFYWPQTGTSGGVGSGTMYTDLAAGATVSSASTFIVAINGTTPNFTTAGNHILGFQFLNEGTGVVNYGYLTISTGANNGYPATITSYRYENNGGAITVVPEPSSVALLSMAAMVLGALGLRQWRRQRAA